MAPARSITAGLFLLLLPAFAAAQDTFDVHAVTVDDYTPGEIPEAHVLGGRRLAFASPAATDCEVVAEYGRMEGVTRLQLTRERRGRMRLEVRSRIGRRGSSSMSRSFRGGPLTCKIGAAIHGRPTTFLFLLSVDRHDEALAQWSVRDAVESATRWVLRSENQGAELAFLARLPLSLHLDMQDRDALMSHLERARISGDVETQAQARAVRLLAGDVDIARSWNSRDPRQRMWMGEALGICFCQAKDPDLKGLFGWRAVDGGEQRELVPALATAIESGGAVLPGDPETRAQRTREILDLASFSRVTWALIGVGLCAAGMIALVFLLRYSARALT